MSHVHKWYLFYKTVSGDVVALCEDPACPEFLGEKEIIDRMNAVEQPLAPDVANCHELHSQWMKLYNFCPECGADVRPAGNANRSAEHRQKVDQHDVGRKSQRVTK